jgi:cobalt/nickel transport system permease protein
MAAAALLGARVPFRAWLACMAAPLGFAVAGALPLAVQVGADGIGPAPGGVALAAALVLRAVAGVSCLAFLALTTPATDLVRGLRRVGLPAEIAEVALLTYRFLFLLAETAAAMDAAQAARLGHAGPWRRLRGLGLLAANLLPRAFDRAHRLEVGLAARGWDGEFRTLAAPAAVSVPAVATIAALEIAVGLMGVLT